ncbi:DNA-binding protein [Microthyrium microscopicum]|uniref:DNA-binding protein n=1 Tax=Microthyrium microscopicum TaxID=703497 RepID=A0A6A6U7P6_9PEZI|nr:DNA-binding protein [Microthyrium microscopicum]
MPKPPPKKVARPETYVQLVAHFLDFLIICIHTILYERDVYPRESFVAIRRYNYPVRHSQVPEVKEWINEAIDSIEVEMKKGAVERVCLIIFSRFGDPLERFVFDLASFPTVTRRDWFVPFASTSPEERKRIREAGLRTANMDQQFRAVMQKLQFMQRDLEPLPEHVSWTIAIEVKDEAEAPGPIENKETPWIPVEPSLQKESAYGEVPAYVGEDIGGVKTTPLRHVEAGEMAFEMWVEEGAAKIDAFEQEHFADEYEVDHTVPPEGLPGFHMEPKIEPSKGKGRALVESDPEEEDEDEDASEEEDEYGEDDIEDIEFDENDKHGAGHKEEANKKDEEDIDTDDSLSQYSFMQGAT